MIYEFYEKRDASFSLISNNVNISNAIIGNNTIVHAGTIIGGDGFGFAPLDGEFIKIPQIGIVKIGDNVEISCKELGRLINTIDEIKNCNKWTFGLASLMKNLSERNLI